MSAVAPTSPSSSPMIAKIMSVWASGRKFAFSMLWPNPRPKMPPEPRPIIACTIWKPAPWASCRAGAYPPLHDLEAAPVGVVPGIDEAEDPRPPIGLEPDRRQSEDRRD